MRETPEDLVLSSVGTFIDDFHGRVAIKKQMTTSRVGATLYRWKMCFNQM